LKAVVSSKLDACDEGECLKETGRGSWFQVGISKLPGYVIGGLVGRRCARSPALKLVRCKKLDVSGDSFGGHFRVAFSNFALGCARGSECGQPGSNGDGCQDHQGTLSYSH
jgi:hypothetical protein